MGWISTLISQRTFRAWGLAAGLVVAMAAIAGGIAFGNTSTCFNSSVPNTPPTTLNGSAFEIDSDANLKVDNLNSSTGCIDWLTGTSASDPFRSGVDWKLDTESGSGDESFGEGTKEDTANPTIVDGSIPPNKSDLKAFGLYSEAGTVSATNPTGKFLELFWARVQDPSGTTNMDFELNQKFCEEDGTNCAGNGVTPVRTGDGPGANNPLADDILITYDLSRGGTRASISIRRWDGSKWGAPTVIAQTEALGTINTSNISTSPIITPQTPTGSLSPRTFGEAAIPFSALFQGSTCGSFGSAYLKSRSSDSFTAALKDFVPPEQVSISNCAALTTNASNTPNTTDPPATIGDPISDVAALGGVTTNAGGTITFNAYGPDDATCSGTPAYTNTVNVSGPGNYVSSASVPPKLFTPTAVGTYRWTASYSGDANNQSASSPCNAANESSLIVKKQPAIETNASNTPDTTDLPAIVGDPISDVATLSGATSDASGSITFTLYSDAECTNEIDTGLEPVTVDGNGDYNSGNYTPDAVGTYYWIASYSGDAKNEAISGDCGDPNESSVVGKAPANISTAQELFPQDSATLTATAGGTPTGTVDFALYGPNDANCSGTAVYTEENVDLTSGVANTDNTSFSVDQPDSGNYKWIVHYDGDATHDEATSSCGKEAFTATIDDDTTN
jgi:hypothetical protein